MSEQPELLPCPFCGGGAVVSADMSEFPQVACDACGASQGKADGPGIAAAIAAWNRRATPAALATSPEVAALIREAEARVWDAAEEIVRGLILAQDYGSSRDPDVILGRAMQAIRAAALLGEKPLTEYERKVAQMKEDFPNGI